MIRKAVLLPLVAVAGLVLVPGVASAESGSSGDVRAAVTCTYETKQAVYLREAKTNQSTGLAWLAQGERFTGPCVIQNGQRLGDCLPGTRTDILWTKGRKDGHVGWIFTACTKPA